MMARSRGGKSFVDDSLVIVCEGSETESPYFQELCKAHPDYRVVPLKSEILDRSQKRKRKVRARQMEDISAARSLEWEYYPGVGEETEADYNRYKAEPTRWVRAAQLLMEKERFYEAWAVYDLDQGREGAHPIAYSMRTGLLHIAFSAYSFEEWILLHFERNPKAFGRSECISSKVVKYKCGHAECSSNENCNGDACLGGYIRKRGFISDYDKDKGRDYAQLTIDRLHVACVNAAWSRTLSNKAVYESNPYTDVDQLVMRLLEKKFDIHWVKETENFQLNGENFTIVKEGGECKLTYVGGKSMAVVPEAKIYWCNDEYKPQTMIRAEDRIVFSKEESSMLLQNKPNDISVVCIKGRNGKEYYCEL